MTAKKSITVRAQLKRAASQLGVSENGLAAECVIFCLSSSVLTHRKTSRLLAALSEAGRRH